MPWLLRNSATLYMEKPLSVMSCFIQLIPVIVGFLFGVLWFVLCPRARILLDSINLLEIDLHFRSRIKGSASGSNNVREKDEYDSSNTSVLITVSMTL